jgi:DNA polymerase-3 subunit gamma/tau
VAYLAIARKWRPSRFADLVGQESVTRTLQNAITNTRVGHAYLFSGSRGVGKTTVARIFAKALRCTDRQGTEPCDRCTDCLAIAESRSIDVVEIDGASNNGVEAVRALRDNVAYAPSSGQYKVYIIDEVHMLSVAAFNALLKTLEEPPKHVLFIFATTEAHRLPATIVSRCLRFEFRRLTQKQIAGRLRHILDAESVGADDDALRLLASQSDGALRDALSLLDQVLAYASGSGTKPHLNAATVTEALGLAPANAALDLLDACLRGDVPALIAEIGKNHSAGADLGVFADRCLDELRGLFLVSVAKEAGATLGPDDLDVAPDKFEHIARLAGSVPSVRFERMAQIFAKTIQQMAGSTQPRFLLEIAAVRMSKLEGLERFASGEAVAAPAEPTESPVTLAAPPPKPRPAPVVAPPTTMRPAAPPPPMPEDPGPPPPEAYAPGPDVPMPEKDWKGFVETVSRKRPLLGALLHHASFEKITTTTPPTAMVSFPSGSFYERQAQESKYRKDIEDAVKSWFGDVVVQVGGKPADQVVSLDRTEREVTERKRQAALEHPLVKKAQELLGAEVVDVEVER